MIKNIIYVEDGSVDLDELESTLTTETKIIVYRQGSNPPTLVQPRVPINDISSEAEFTGDGNTIEDLSFLVANAIINNSTAEETTEYLYKNNYRKQSETVKEFVVKAEQRFREDSKWLDIMLKGYDCKDSEDYDAVASAIIRGRFVNSLNDLAAQYDKEEE